MLKMTDIVNIFFARPKSYEIESKRDLKLYRNYFTHVAFSNPFFMTSF